VDGVAECHPHTTLHRQEHRNQRPLQPQGPDELGPGVWASRPGVSDIQGFHEKISILVLKQARLGESS
jgi:hypothetical protein